MASVNTKINTHNLVICANMFVRHGDKILMLKRSPKKKIAPNYLHPAGGKINRNEDPLVAAKRELLEEAGLTVNNIKLEAVVTEIEPRAKGENWLIFHFSGDFYEGVLKKTPEGEFIWVKKEELLTSNSLFPSVKAIISYIVDHNKGTAFASFIYKNFDDKNVKLLDLSICKAG